MKNKIINQSIIIILIFLLIEILTNKTLISNTILFSLNLWVNTLIPSMFPIFIISDILINYHITNYIPNTLKKILNINENIISILLLSILSGFPNNARIINKMYKEKQITEEEANKIILFTHFSNPIFILTTISLFFFKEEKYGPIILISHYIGNIIILIITNNNKYNKNNYTKEKIKSQKITKILISSIKNSIDSLLTILGIITIFLILSNIITNKLNLDPYTSSIIKGLLEITSGINSLSNLSIPDIYKVTLSTIFISFGGLSIHMQVLGELTNLKIKYHTYFLSRIFHSIISGTISYILYILLI